MNPPGSKRFAKAYPICTYTYVILRTQSDKANLLKPFVTWALTRASSPGRADLPARSRSTSSRRQGDPQECPPLSSQNRRACQSRKNGPPAPPPSSGGAASVPATRCSTSSRCVAALTAVVLLILITRQVLAEAWPAMQKFGLAFLTTQAWGDKGNTLFGAKSFIFGTVVTSLRRAAPRDTDLARDRALPQRARAALDPRRSSRLSSSCSPRSRASCSGSGDPRPRPVHHRHARARAPRPLGWLPIFSTKPTVGSNMFAAILILTIMIIPIVSSICRELFVDVPRELKEGALALGATRWEVVRGVVFPYARAGIAAALILGLGRALGEAIAVTQVIGNRVAINLVALRAGRHAREPDRGAVPGRGHGAPDRLPRLPRGHPPRLLADREPRRAADRPARRGRHQGR